MEFPTPEGEWQRTTRGTTETEGSEETSWSDTKLNYFKKNFTATTNTHWSSVVAQNFCQASAPLENKATNIVIITRVFFLLLFYRQGVKSLASGIPCSN